MTGSDRADGAVCRVLVTGASGFVGRRLCARLYAEGRVEVLPVRGPYGADGPGPAVDLALASEVAALVQTSRPHVIVHLAAFSSVGAGVSQPNTVWRSNFDATRALASAAGTLGRRVRFVFASTAEVYGAGFNDGPRNEASPLAPSSAYARSKAACEYLLRDFASETLEIIALRLFNHTGPGQDDRFVVPSLAAQLAALGRGKAGEVDVGNLDAKRDFTDVEDMIDAYMAVLTAPRLDPHFQVYNVGSGRQRRIRDILDQLIAGHAAEVRIKQDPARLRPSDVPSTPAVFDAFRDRFGWSPKRSFDLTLAEVYAHELGRAENGR